MRGRKPVPNSLKLVRGSRRVHPNEPQPNTSIPACPEHLNAEARAEWERITPDLHEAGLLARIDGAALAAYCQVWARWVNAENELANLGPIVKSPSGYPIQNPYLSIACSHTHSGPCTLNIVGSNPDAAFLEKMEFAIVESVVDAGGRLEPVTLGLGASSAYFNVNHRPKPESNGSMAPNTAEIVDRRVRVLQVDNAGYTNDMLGYMTT